MKIIFTGATSFTGHLFVERLAKEGHTVIAPLQSKKESYSGLRKERLDRISSLIDIREALPFGSEEFLDFLGKIPSFDLFCHHASCVTNYKSPDFDPIQALSSNCFEARKVLTLCKEKGATSFILTGSVFEKGEGSGSQGLPAVSPYGLSKGMTADFYRHFVPLHGLQFKKFVIPNPFGPWEEFRFTSMLAKNWLEGKKSDVTHGRYVRDNIPSTQLAEAYLHFLTSPQEKTNPSGFPEMQGSFALRFQKEMQKRFNLPCELNFIEQIDFREPQVRINTDLCLFPFNENQFWDETADFYIKTYSPR